MSDGIPGQTSFDLKPILYEGIKLAFSRRLMFLIDASGLSKKELAVLLNVHPSALSHWLKGKRLPDAEILYDLIQVFKLEGSGRTNLIVAWHQSLLADQFWSCFRRALAQEDIDTAFAILDDLFMHPALGGRPRSRALNRIEQPSNQRVKAMLHADISSSPSGDIIRLITYPELGE